MPQPFDAFGRLIPGVDVASLPLSVRVDLFRRFVGHVLADAQDPGHAYFAAAMSQWLSDGGDLQQLLGLRAERGTRTVHARMRRDRVIATMQKLVTAAGSRSAAARAMQSAAAPAAVAGLVAELQAMRAPHTRRAIGQLLRSRDATSLRSCTVPAIQSKG